jgi:hypothetical protein
MTSRSTASPLQASCERLPLTLTLSPHAGRGVDSLAYAPRLANLGLASGDAGVGVGVATTSLWNGRAPASTVIPAEAGIHAPFR